MDLNLWKPIAGIALFLLALSLIEETIRRISGPRFKKLLVNHTDTPLEGIVSGTVATAILQSSSFVSLLMLAFVGARLIPLKNAIAVVIGANLGTTATGWIVATIGFKLDLEGLALPLIGIGGLLAAVIGKSSWRQYARLCMALGLLLLGLQYMKGAVDDVSALIDADFLDSLTALDYLLVGIVFSAVVQSSSATIVVALSALDGGVIGLADAAAIAIGADFGTTSTVLLGTIGASANKKRVALGHFVFNLITDIIGFAMRLPLLGALAWIGDPALILVAFHSVMNLIGILVFLPFLGAFTGFLERRFVGPDRRVCRFLDDVPVSVSDAAVRAVEQEVEHLVRGVLGENQRVLGLEQGPDRLVSSLTGGDEDQLLQSYETFKELEGELLAYGLNINRAELDLGEQERLESLLRAARSAIVSLRASRDARVDLLKLVDVNPVLREEGQRRVIALYDAAHACLDGSVDSIVEAGDALQRLVEKDHNELHQAIMQQIGAGGVHELMVSTALNLNRALYHANHALVVAVQALVASESQASGSAAAAEAQAQA